MRVHSEIDAPSFLTSVARIARHANASVLCALGGGPRRQSELLDIIGTLNEATLAMSLRELDRDGLIARRVDPGPPLRVLYELTPRGTALASWLRPLRDWTSAQA